MTEKILAIVGMCIQLFIVTLYFPSIIFIGLSIYLFWRKNYWPIIFITICLLMVWGIGHWLQVHECQYDHT